MSEANQNIGRRTGGLGLLPRRALLDAGVWAGASLPLNGSGLPALPHTGTWEMQKCLGIIGRAIQKRATAERRRLRRLGDDNARPARRGRLQTNPKAAVCIAILEQRIPALFPDLSERARWITAATVYAKLARVKLSERKQWIAVNAERARKARYYHGGRGRPNSGPVEGAMAETFAAKLPRGKVLAAMVG